jgi:uncharacterized membrane protein
LLCYLLPLAPLLLWRRTSHRMVRFHAWQSLLFFTVLAIFNLALLVLTAAAYRFSWDAGMQTSAILRWIYWFQFGLWLLMLHAGYTLEHLRLPWIGPAADQLAGDPGVKHAGPATKLPLAQPGSGPSSGL